MISKISKVGQIISKFNWASEVTPMVQISNLYVTKQKVCQAISKISKVGKLISKFHSTSEITAPSPNLKFVYQKTRK
jgi:hypothetical protein